MTRLQANLLLLAVAAIWGFTFVLQAQAMDSVGPFWFVGLRFSVATLVVLPLAVTEYRHTDTPINVKNAIGFSIIGLALFLGSIAQQFGLMTTSVTNSGFLTALYVVFVPILSLLLLRRFPHWVVWPSALCALFGIFLLSGGRLDGMSGGDLLTVLSAVFFAVQLLLSGLLIFRCNRPMALCLFQFAICGAAGLMVAAIFEPFQPTLMASRWPEILVAGVFSSGLGFIGQVIGQKYTTAPQAAIFLCSESLFAALAGALFLGERITVIGYVGCGFIFVALLAVEIIPELKGKQTVTANQ
jgi:drug/metabolite transporter (DMT)-like permease